MSSFVYNTAKAELMKGDLHLDSDTLKVCLMGTGYTPDPDHDYMDDINADELSGTGYTAGHGNSGRKAVASAAVAVDDTNNRATFDLADITWSSIDAGTAKGAVIIRQGTSDDTDALLIAWIDTGGFPIVTNTGDLTITWNAVGGLTLS